MVMHASMFYPIYLIEKLYATLSIYFQEPTGLSVLRLRDVGILMPGAGESVMMDLLLNLYNRYFFEEMFSVTVNN